MPDIFDKRSVVEAPDASRIHALPTIRNSSTTAIPVRPNCMPVSSNSARMRNVQNRG